MANLFIAYDLMAPGQNYDRVRDAIRSLGQWHQFQYSLFYVSTLLSPQDAYNRVIVAMDRNDKLAVIDAAAGVVTDWDEPPVDEINAIWNYQPRFGLPPSLKLRDTFPIEGKRAVSQA